MVLYSADNGSDRPTAAAVLAAGRAGPVLHILTSNGITITTRYN